MKVKHIRIKSGLCPEYLTDGKLYPIKEFFGENAVYFDNDNGRMCFTCLEGSSHLRGGDFEIVEEQVMQVYCKEINSDIGYLTAGKHYDVLEDRGSQFCILDDEGDDITVWREGCVHTGSDWFIVEEKQGPVYAMNPDVAALQKQIEVLRKENGDLQDKYEDAEARATRLLDSYRNERDELLQANEHLKNARLSNETLREMLLEEQREAEKLEKQMAQIKEIIQ